MKNSCVVKLECAKEQIMQKNGLNRVTENTIQSRSIRTILFAVITYIVVTAALAVILNFGYSLGIDRLTTDLQERLTSGQLTYESVSSQCTGAL